MPPISTQDLDRIVGDKYKFAPVASPRHGQRVATAAGATETTPTDGQKIAGNYKKGRMTWNGLKITIENPKGSTRRGVDKNGKRWECKMGAHYGYLRQQELGADGDPLDIYIGDHPDSELVFIIDQRKGKDGKTFDEHKIVLGTRSEQEARDTYLSCYCAGWKGLMAITPMTLPRFKKWLADDSKKKPAFKLTKAVETDTGYFFCNHCNKAQHWTGEDCPECGASMERGEPVHDPRKCKKGHIFDAHESDEGDPNQCPRCGEKGEKVPGGTELLKAMNPALPEAPQFEGYASKINGDALHDHIAARPVVPTHEIRANKSYWMVRDGSLREAQYNHAHDAGQALAATGHADHGLEHDEALGNVARHAGIVRVAPSRHDDGTANFEMHHLPNSPQLRTMSKLFPNERGRGYAELRTSPTGYGSHTFDHYNKFADAIHPHTSGTPLMKGVIRIVGLDLFKAVDKIGGASNAAFDFDAPAPAPKTVTKVKTPTTPAISATPATPAKWEYSEGAPGGYKSEPFQGACQHCGTAIKNLHWVADHGTKRALCIGSECVKKLTGETGDAATKRIQRETKAREFNAKRAEVNAYAKNVASKISESFPGLTSQLHNPGFDGSWHDKEHVGRARVWHEDKLPFSRGFNDDVKKLDGQWNGEHWDVPATNAAKLHDLVQKHYPARNLRKAIDKVGGGQNAAFDFDAPATPKVKVSKPAKANTKPMPNLDHDDIADALYDGAHVPIEHVRHFPVLASDFGMHEKWNTGQSVKIAGGDHAGKTGTIGTVEQHSNLPGKLQFGVRFGDGNQAMVGEEHLDPASAKAGTGRTCATCGNASGNAQNCASCTLKRIGHENDDMLAKHQQNLRFSSSLKYDEPVTKALGDEEYVVSPGGETTYSDRRTRSGASITGPRRGSDIIREIDGSYLVNIRIGKDFELLKAHDAWKNQPRVPKGKAGSGRWQSSNLAAAPSPNPPQQTDDLLALWDHAKVGQFPPPPNKIVEWRDVTPTEAAIVKRQTGLSIEGFRHTAASHELRHIHNQHGEGSTKVVDQGQEAVTRQDMARLKLVVARPDKVHVEMILPGQKDYSAVTPSDLTDPANAARERRLIYERTFRNKKTGKTQHLIVTFSKKQRRLALRTFYKSP